MQNYKMTIAYDGRRYTGFNKEKRNVDKSIQGKLEEILKKCYQKDIEVIGAVNTAAGVHAKKQIVNFTVPNNKLNATEIKKYFERYLTDDIIVLDAEKVDERFHSRYLAKSVTYKYRLWKKDATKRPLFQRQYVNLMSQKLDVDKMKKAANDFLGEHNFLAYSANRRIKKSIKEVYDIQIEETKNEIIIKITANSFLLNMERIMVGTLIQMSLWQLPMDVIVKSYDLQDGDEVGHKASADALCLVDINY